MTKQVNVRLPEFSRDKLDRLEKKTGMTRTQVLIIAIDRLALEELAEPVAVDAG